MIVLEWYAEPSGIRANRSEFKRGIFVHGCEKYVKQLTLKAPEFSEKCLKRNVRVILAVTVRHNLETDGSCG